MTTEAQAEERVGLARRFLATLSAMDFDALGELVSEDAVIEFPFGSGGHTAVGRAAVVQHLRDGVTGFLKSIEFQVTAAYPGHDREVVVLEYSSQGVLQTGRPYANQYVAIFRIRQGRIRLFREYFNPVATAPAS
ncbi:MAG: hypothetical protein JWQ97_4166 [Phenylobacterium sp.]|nr:hypothetical protein [Phenylobacterium sp.]